jgi:hypothetical protein
VVGGVWKKCEKLPKKGRQNIFGREFWRLVWVLKKRSPKYSGQPPAKLISLYALAGGAKFISSPWAHKWLATALLTKPTEKLENGTLKKFDTISPIFAMAALIC